MEEQIRLAIDDLVRGCRVNGTESATTMMLINYLTSNIDDIVELNEVDDDNEQSE